MWFRIFIIYTWVLANYRNTKAFTLPRVCGSYQPKFYDVDENVCCNGALYPLLARNGTRYGCCSRTDSDTQELYDKDVYLCCGTQLVPLYDGAYKRECCKGDDENEFPGEIKEKGQTCCNGRAHYLKKNEGCCDAMPYNTERFICCPGDKFRKASLHKLNDSVKYQECCGNNTFDAEKAWCDDRAEPPVVKENHIRLCNGTDYDVRTHVCCSEDGTLLKIPDVDLRYPKEFVCCNKRLIDTLEKKCCSGDSEKGIIPHAIYKHRICCGNASVAGDSPTDQCCNGVPNKIDSQSAQEPYKCCGTRFVKESNCCNGEEIPFEYSCCGGTVQYSKNSAYGCCNGEVYDTNHQLCCQKSSAIKYIIDKNSTDTDCCWSTLTPYNRFTHDCTARGIRMRPETRNANILVCPYCRRRIDTEPSTYCKARNVFEVKITSIRNTDKGSVLNTVTDTGRRIRVRIPYRCHCLRKDTKYLIFTSRRIRNGRLRLKSKSMFFTKDNYTLGEVKRVCAKEKKIEKTVRKLMKQETG